MTATAQGADISDCGATGGVVRRSRDEITACLGIDAPTLRNLVKDLYSPRVTIYWINFLLSILVGYGALLAFPIRHPLSVPAFVAFPCAVLACYRATIFVHELAHARGKQLAGFRLAWNILCGVPLFIPSFLYEAHKTHHIARTFGSTRDGEYLPLGRLPWWSAVGLLAASLLVPAELMFRFVVLGPLSWLVPRLRARVLSREFALMIIDADYRRPAEPGRTPRRWLIQEAGCFAWGVMLVTAVSCGIIPPARIAEGYAVVAGVSLLNALRVVVAHRYLGAGEPMTFAEQVLDSNSFPSLWAELWAPVGLRYHGVHHLLPSLPYHALPQAHHRIMCAIPQDSPYRSTLRGSLFSELAQLFRTCGDNPGPATLTTRAQSSTADWA